MSRLEDVSLQYRTCSVARNDYDNDDQYVAGHPDALSTGDALGKGESNGAVGSATDIKVRNTLMTKNKYNRDREYNSGSA
jgi:hypothetical protein